MLFTPGGDFNWSVDNFGATYTEAGFAAAVTASGSANTKGTAVELIADTSVTEDVYGISICFARTNTTVTSIRFLTDLLIDPAGGTSYSVAIANILCHNPALLLGGYWYYFPLYLKAGTTIGAQTQSSTGGSAIRMGVRLWGKPSRPELIKVGTKVQTLGAATGSTSGTAVTPGTSALGSYSATLGTLNLNSWWWQAGLGFSDTSLTGSGYLIDVAANATNKILVAQNIMLATNSSENVGKAALGSSCPQMLISAGQDVYVRAACSTTPDSTVTAVVHAVGG